MSDWLVDGILIVIIILSVLLNGIVNIAFIKNWNELDATGIILFSLTVCDFFQSITGYPLELRRTFKEGSIRCIIAAYSTITLSLISMSILTSLSVGKMLTISYPLQLYNFMKRKTNGFYFVIPSIGYGLIWGSLPLLGWSKYTLELKRTNRCTINFNDKTYGTISYLYSLLVFCYILPLLLMTLSFVKIGKELQKMSRCDSRRRGSLSKTRESKNLERKMAGIIITMIIVFLLCWTPYAILVLFVSFDIKIPSGYADIAAMLGKSSTVYNPIIYVIMYKRFRTYVFNLFQRRRTFFRDNNQLYLCQHCTTTSTITRRSESL